MIAEIAQLGERQTEDLKVPGSNPENSHEFCGYLYRRTRTSSEKSRVSADF